MSNEKQTLDENRFEKFKITLDFLKFEATILWQIFSAFFVAHSIIVGFLIDHLKEQNYNDINWGLFLFFGILGVILSIFWLMTFNSNSQWYYYRMEQAKRDELNLCCENDWYLLNKEAEKFSKNLPLKNKIGGYGIIVTFILVYIISICFSIFRMSCKC